MIERDALVGIDAIFNTVYVEGGVCGCEAALGLDGSVFLGACLDRPATLDGEVLVGSNTLVLGSPGGDGSVVVNRDIAVCLMPSDAPVALTLPEPLIARSPPALMASSPVLVALTDPAPSMLILPVDRIASSVDVTLSVLPASPWILSSAFSLVP